MAAAAFTATLLFGQGSASGPVRQWRATVSDVAAAYYIFADGNAFLTLPPGGTWVLKDLILSAAGTDTTNAQIFVNGVNIGVVVANAANVGTVYNRQFMSGPIAIAGGSTVKFVQAA